MFLRTRRSGHGIDTVESRRPLTMPKHKQMLSMVIALKLAAKILYPCASPLSIRRRHDKQGRGTVSLHRRWKPPTIFEIVE